LRDTPLRYALVTDLLYMAHDDRASSLRERTVIETIARYLDIDFRQLDAMDQFADGALRNRPGRLPVDDRGDNVDLDRTVHVFAILAAFFVPPAAIPWYGGGLQGQQVANGLSAMSPTQEPIMGLAVVLLLAAAVFFVVRWIGLMITRLL
jgi:hypothetical protein